MSAPYWSGQVARHLSDAVAAHRQRVRALNRVAEGEPGHGLTAEQREGLRASEKRILRALDELSDGQARERLRVVSVDAPSEREMVPRALREAYELLAARAYGSDPAVSVGDPAVERGIGKRTARTASGQAVTGGGAAVATKRYGQGTRSVVKDRAAYDLKVRTDRTLRRLAREVLEGLDGRDPGRAMNACGRCGRTGRDAWSWCPSCGHEMVKQEG